MYPQIVRSVVTKVQVHNAFRIVFIYLFVISVSDLASLNTVNFFLEKLLSSLNYKYSLDNDAPIAALTNYNEYTVTKSNNEHEIMTRHSLIFIKQFDEERNWKVNSGLKRTFYIECYIQKMECWDLYSQNSSTLQRTIGEDHPKTICIRLNTK